ncbi:MAG: hypothetical protein KGY76_07670 [Candidatus Thermoplasmatota archaeon]|nr:hypothetical protein [Candidatus Thermoplasmatota archaeon]
MGEGSDVGLLERARGFFKTKSITPSDKVDEHLTRNLPDYIKEYKLATESDLKGVDKRIEEFVTEVSELKDWKEETKERMHEDRHKIEKLEEELGIEGES